MGEKYFKIKKEFARRAGFDGTLRHEADAEHLMLSEKDIRMIPLTVEEKIAALGGNAGEYTEAGAAAVDVPGTGRKQKARDRKEVKSKNKNEDGND